MEEEKARRLRSIKHRLGLALIAFILGASGGWWYSARFTSEAAPVFGFFLRFCGFMAGGLGAALSLGIADVFVRTRQRLHERLSPDQQRDEAG